MWGSNVLAARRHTRYGMARARILFPAVAMLLLTGCWSGPNGNGQRELQMLREKVARQNDQMASQKATIDTLTEQINTIRAIKPDDLKLIFHPVTLEIEALSGGFDVDGQPGDDGVAVYLKPIDAQGDVLKAAGEIRIQLYDLAAEPDDNLIGEYIIPVAQARELWYGKLMTNHYTVKCPWPRSAPAHPEITIRATFIDYLTQRVMSAQATCKVKLPL
ncbi:MAG: hypothetical protein ABIG44_02440 [Planctomycetota bacterium]